MAVTIKVPRTCWICGTAVTLETCKVDEHGLPVHEACQTLKLALQNGTLSKRSSSPARIWERHPKTG